MDTEPSRTGFRFVSLNKRVGRPKPLGFNGAMADAEAPKESAAVMDIFSLIAAQSAEAGGMVTVQRDAELIFVGSKQAGKGTLINSFLMRDDAPKPTTALEYRFARRSTGANGAAAVCNIWELGGGSQLSELLKVVMLSDRLESCVVAITLDLAAAGDALATMLLWFEQVRKQLKLAFEQVRHEIPTLRFTHKAHHRTSASRHLDGATSPSEPLRPPTDPPIGPALLGELTLVCVAARH